MARKKNYPANLLAELKINEKTNSQIDYDNLTDDQMAGLEYTLNSQLTEREIIAFGHYYKERLSCRKIAERYEMTEYRIKQIISRALRKISSNPEWFFYIVNGYEAQTEYIQQQLAQEEQKYCEQHGIRNKSHIYYADLFCMDFPARIYNPLDKAGIKTVRDLLIYLGTSNNIRHLGELSCKQVCERLAKEKLISEDMEKNWKKHRFFNLPHFDEELRAFKKLNEYS